MAMASKRPFSAFRASGLTACGVNSTRSILHGYAALHPRRYATETSSSKTPKTPESSRSSSASESSSPSSSSKASTTTSSNASSSRSSQSDLSLPPGWEDDPNFNITNFNQLPHASFGHNQHIIINQEFKEALRQILWQFKAPIRYAFAYGSGVFPQSSGPPSSPAAQIHPHPPSAVTKWQETGQKSIDFIFGVSYTQHWHSLNLQQHRDHYSFLGSLGSGVISRVQDKYGAGAYFHPYITVNGTMIKYGVVNLDTLYRDLSEWDTMYMAGRLHKPVKILRDDARIRLANQVNLISALRTALLLLPPTFTERDLYMKIASISYMGDPRIALRAESPRKVADIVDNQMTSFRQLYLPLIKDLPNAAFDDPAVSKPSWVADPSLNCKIQQDMDPIRRGNMVHRLPKKFRQRLYDSYRRSFNLSQDEYQSLTGQGSDDRSFGKSVGTDFDRRIAQADDVGERIVRTVKTTINRPSLIEAVKGVATAGVAKSWRYLSEKRAKGRNVKRIENKRQQEKQEKQQEEEKSGENRPTQGSDGSGANENQKEKQ